MTLVGGTREMELVGLRGCWQWGGWVRGTWWWEWEARLIDILRREGYFSIRGSMILSGNYGTLWFFEGKVLCNLPSWKSDRAPLPNTPPSEAAFPSQYQQHLMILFEKSPKGAATCIWAECPVRVTSSSDPRSVSCR